MSVHPFLFVVQEVGDRAWVHRGHVLCETPNVRHGSDGFHGALRGHVVLVVRGFLRPKLGCVLDVDALVLLCLLQEELDEGAVVFKQAPLGPQYFYFGI